MNKKYYHLFAAISLFVGLIILSSFSANDKTKEKEKEDAYNIKLRIKGLKDTICYLGYYFADKQYVLDTERIDATGLVVFKGKKALDGGIYFFYSPEKTLIQFLISDAQKFSLETDTIDLIQNMKITGSQENLLFSNFHKYRMSNYSKVQSLKKRLDKNKSNKDSTAFINKQIEKIDIDVLSFMKDAAVKYPGSFYATILNSNLQIEIPDSPKDANGKEIDSLFALHYLQKHYFDYTNFGDGRIVRSPILHQKIMDYVKRLVVPHPDSIVRACDFIIQKSKADTGVFRYVLPTLTNYYETSKYMGMDAVFVHLAEKYYLSKQAWWADSTMLAKMGERVRDLKPTLIGGTAHNIVMYDTLLRQVPLYSIKANYTAIFFYEPDCGHCKKTTPKMVKLHEAYKSKGFEVFGVNLKTDIPEWKKFIKEYKTRWVNVSDPYHKSFFRNYFDIYSSPVIYLIDKDKKILAKRLSAEQLEDMLRMKLGIKGDDGRVLDKPKNNEEEKHED
jgi:thiol-disulfide isomerase/thioredoxin